MSMRTKPGYVVIAALLVAACGGGEVVDDATTSTASTAATTSTVPLVELTSVVYFLQDSGGSKHRPGPFLLPVSRTIEPTGSDDLANLAQALLAGPSEDQLSAGISSAVPEGTLVNAVSVNDGVASVDLSETFDDGGGTFSMGARLAQLVFTFTRLGSIDAVELLLDGEPVEVFSSEGIIIDGPMTREGFVDLQPLILVDEPAWGAVVGPEFTISGTAAVFEAVFQMEVLDESGAAIFDPDFVQTTQGMGWGDFAEPVTAEPGSNLTIHVWEESAEDGSVINERFIPVEVRS